MKRVYYYDLSIGKIGIEEEKGAISRIIFGNELKAPDVEEMETPIIKETAKQLAEYLAGKRKAFDLPLKLKGTSFQMQVWQALTTIPYGETRSYRQIAEQIGNPKACRAVGLANNRNPIPIIIPCHRVIGTNGKLVGYGGGLEIKKRLLELEAGLLSS